MFNSQKNKDFENVYISHFSKMKRFAKEYVLSEEDAANIVQDVFTDLWERWNVMSSHNNLFAYLFISVKSRCIDFLRRETISRKAEDELLIIYQSNYDILDGMNYSLFSENDIESLLHKALETLPERCREIFIKNKIEGQKQKNIAKELNISLNTVENQMAIAYKKLRIELKDFLPLLIFLIS